MGDKSQNEKAKKKKNDMWSRRESANKRRWSYYR